MMKKILLVIMALLIAFPAIAWDDDEEKEKERNKKYPYKSSSGQRYKYDLNKPGDKIRYEVDPGAQVKDSINPRVELDRDLGQYGGGAE